MEDIGNGYTLRAATRADIPAFARIEDAADALFDGTGLLDSTGPDDNVPPGVYEAAIEQRLVFVAADPGGAVGFALCSLRPPDLYLDQIAVDPEHGRQGLGKALMLRVIREAEARGVESVSLSTFRDVPWNAPYYERFGFKELARKKFEPWMADIEEVQAQQLDISKRCFMRRHVRKRWPGFLYGR